MLCCKHPNTEQKVRLRDEVRHRSERVLDHVEADGTGKLVDVGVVNAVDEANSGGFVRILLWELNVHFPVATGEGGCSGTMWVCLNELWAWGC